MSAPPMAMTMCTPNSSATAVMTMSAVMPAWGLAACRNSRPNQITTKRPARLSQCRPGSSSGLPPILAESLPKAISEPEKVTAPMKMPR